MSNQVIVAPPTQVSFGEMERLADSVARCGLFGIKTKEQALVLMAISQAEGRHPALAARDYDIIQNRPAKKAEAMLRDFITAGGKVEWHALTDSLADATFSHPQGGSARITWDVERAKVAGLLGKDMYKKFPRQMLRSRAVSEGVRTVCPAATSGLYVPEEVADFDAPRIVAPAQPPAEVRTIIAPAAAEPPHDPATGEIARPHTIPVPQSANGDGTDWISWGRALIGAVKAAPDRDALEAWLVHNGAALEGCRKHATKAHGSIMRAVEAMRGQFPEATPAESTDSGGLMPEWLTANDAPDALRSA